MVAYEPSATRSTIRTTPPSRPGRRALRLRLGFLRRGRPADSSSSTSTARRRSVAHSSARLRQRTLHRRRPPLGGRVERAVGVARCDLDGGAVRTSGRDGTLQSGRPGPRRVTAVSSSRAISPTSSGDGRASDGSRPPLRRLDRGVRAFTPTNVAFYGERLDQLALASLVRHEDQLDSRRPHRWSRPLLPLSR